MKVTSLRIQNFRSFVDSEMILLSDINVLVGANNSGKSSIIRALHSLQEGAGDLFSDVRAGSKNATIDIVLADVPDRSPFRAGQPGVGTTTFHVNVQTDDRRSGTSETRVGWGNGTSSGANFRAPNTEPNHFVVPFLSKRKTGGYSEQVREQDLVRIGSDMSLLAAKLTRASNPAFPGYAQYADACKEILGFVVTFIQSANGMLAGIYLPDGPTVSIDQMGDGVPNIVFLLVNLATSKGKHFLIEEPENDIHPQALKALLNLIAVSARENGNQFVISTHSNIVVSHLCAIEGSRLYKIESEKGVLPTEAKIEAVPETAEARVRVLQELGYAFSDFDLWDGWLLLEESSAEQIIRGYLIPWFAPGLTRVKTVSANGATKVEPAFADLHRLMLFTHLQPAYQGRAWVRVDGDEVGKQVVQKLKDKFPLIAADRFATLDESQFEAYYPSVFGAQVQEVLGIQDRQNRRTEKAKLLREVIAWLDKDSEQAKRELAKSAASVIQSLRDIERQFKALAKT